LIHIDKDQIDASRVLPLPQTTGMVYHQNDRNAYEVVLTVERLDGSLEGYDGYVIWTYEDGSTAMQDVVIQPPNTIRHAISPALLAKAGEVSVSLIVYNEADAYRRTLAQWLCRVLPEAQEPAVPPEEPAIPILQSLLLDAQALRHDVEAALNRAEAVEQGTERARADAQTAQAGAEAAKTGAQAALGQAQAAAAAAQQSAQDAAGSATTAAQSAAQASNNATDAQSAKLDAQTARAGAQSAQAAAEDARDETQATVGSMVPKSRTVNGKALSSDVTLAYSDVKEGRSAITAVLGTNFSHEVVKWGQILVPLNQVTGLLGSGLSLATSGTIVIGNGITGVWASGELFQELDDIANDAMMAFIYHKRDGQIITGFETGPQGDLQASHRFYSANIGPKLLTNLQAGDEIGLYVYGGSDPGTIYVNASRANLTVVEA
jgi:hypothetical protein